MAQCVMIATGGTGGHVFPAIAVGEVLMARGYRVEFISDKRGERFFSGTNIFPNIVSCSAIPKDFKDRLIALCKIGWGVLQGFEYCREYEPDVVVGFGGYPSFPPVFAAQMLKKPTVLHEQNGVLGRAHRQVMDKATYIATSFPEVKSLPDRHKKKMRFTGNPVRKGFFQGEAVLYTAPVAGQKFQLLVFGGSQGASLFGEVVPAAVEKLPQDLRDNLSVVQQARADDAAAVKKTYQDIGVEARIQTFFKDMAQLYARSHLVVCRAGASTVAELTQIGRPALFIPLAASLEGDQAENARQLVARKAGWLVNEAELTPDILAEKLTALMRDPAQLSAAAEAVQALNTGNAAEQLADVIVSAMAKDE